MKKHTRTIPYYPWATGATPSLALRVLALALLPGLWLGQAQAAPPQGPARPFCSDTSTGVFRACRLSVRADFLITSAKCTNVADAAQRADCRHAAAAARQDGLTNCDGGLSSRQQICAALGEARYAPDFSPARFVNPDDIGHSVAPNPYLPIVVGNQWTYEGAGEHVVVTVTAGTKLIEGVTCRVVTDKVTVKGKLAEDTQDWLAQDLDGNVWYCGEATQELETSPGDRPRVPEIVRIDGTFKSGRDLDKPGFFMLGAPQPGVTYREEYSIANAEDLAEVLSLNGTETSPGASCNGTCLVTRNFTPEHPVGRDETKFYAPGVGQIVTIAPDGARIELLSFTQQ